MKHENDQDFERRLKTGKISGLIGIAANLALSIGKLVAGTVAGSVSVTADGFNNLSDAASSVVTLLGFRLSEKPADGRHPFGHARYEYISGLAVAAMIIVIAFELGKSSVEKIFHPSSVNFSRFTAAVLLASIAVKAGLAYFNRKTGKKIRSETLIATAADSLNDVIATSAVLVAAAFEYFFKIKIDAYMGIAVAVFILVSGIGLAKKTVSPLIGEGADPELKKKISDHICGYDKVLGCHDLLIHDYGPGKRFASVHVEFDRNDDPMACHRLIDKIERESLGIYGVHLVIHYDPVVTDDPELTRLREIVTSFLKMRDKGLTVHDFRTSCEGDATKLCFDVSLPEKLAGQENDIGQSLDEALKSLGEGKYITDITFDPTEDQAY